MNPMYHGDDEFEYESGRYGDKTRIINGVKMVFANKSYVRRIENSKARWLDEDINTVAEGISSTLDNLPD